ncbi:MAG: type II secretion system protein [bacterium]|nr:type II secretion system protein [bacterium]
MNYPKELIKGTVGEKGFTLLEVLSAICLLGLLMAVMAPAFVSQMRFNTESQYRTEAIAAAQQVLDGYRRQDPVTLPANGTLAPVEIEMGARRYLVTTTFCAEAAYCPTNNTRQITVQVTRGGRQYYEVSTVYTRLR